MSADLIPIDCEPPDGDVIAKLEETLAIAREGRVSAVAIAVVYRDGSTGDAWSKPHSIATLLGATSVLAQRLASLLTTKD